MAYSSKNWWIEFALFVSVSAISAVVLTLLWAMALDGREQSGNGLLVLVPSVIIGLLCARLYRRQHVPPSTH
ncbi:hypothetical protein [Streptomyces lichenis]|uniref:Uncharacterized protein n=1 Tax=Streptomyces lichenis TaxID=2306967 RepID=A0ABT0IAU6_9ACTN|nr:hypothetical protein [Streptomyces lichenis]MCK8678447.1 hypothetical protein [Streptomyces lichenis]